eukprot:gene8579-14587_t
MIRYQFRPNLVDHSQIFVIVRPFYNATDQDLGSVNEKLGCYQFAKTQNDSNRIIRFKFHKGFPREHMDWGKMQIHRRPVGLLGFARLSPDPSLHSKDMDKIMHRFANIKLQYETVLFDSRCIVLCSEKPAGPSNQNFIFLEDSDDGQSAEFAEFMHDFMSSLFVVLESKRIEKSNEKLEKMEMPIAPIEQEQAVNDFDTRIMKRKVLGRNRKLLADFCLLSGMYQEALIQYAHSSENLRAVADHLWMGAAIEGLCAASLLMTKVEVPSMDSKFTLQSSGNSSASQGDLNLEDDKSKVYVPLTDDEIIAKYSEVLSCYRRFQTGHIEMEAHLKFIRLLLDMKKVLEGCQVIQCLLSLHLGYNDSERIDLCQVLASLFDQINLKRKAAFFRRRAAHHAFKQTNANIGMLRYANGALNKTASGYFLDLKTHARPKQGTQCGWSAIQLKLLLDMLHVSNRLGDTMNCVRLLCYILENYSGIILENRKADLINRLEDCSAKAEEQRATNKVDDIEMIRSLPIVRNFQPRPLANHLKPKKQQLEPEQGGPFIFSSLSFQAKKKKVIEEVLWVCGDVVEVGMTVDNPLPAEIKVKQMILVTEGIQFEAFPATLALPAESGSFPFMLLGIPHTPGNLIIKGYKVDVFGIENMVLLDEPITVKVAPSLPLMRLSSTLQTASFQNPTNTEDEHYQTLFTSLSSYRGHSTPTTVTIENIGKIPIRSISTKIKKATEKVPSFDENALQSIVPLEAGQSAELHIQLMSEEAWKIQPFAEKIQSTLTFFYTGDDDSSAGFGREISLVVDIKVMPSLSISNYDVYEIDKHPCCCCLCFDVQNHASIDMMIETSVVETEDIKPGLNCPHKTETFMQAKGRKTSKTWIYVVSLEQSDNTNTTFVFPVTIDIPGQSFWKSDSRYSGTTFLADIDCTAEMVNVLKPRHLEMRISVNNSLLQEGDKVSTFVGQMTHLHIQLMNAHEFDLHDLKLQIRTHQGEVGDDAYDVPPPLPLFSHCGTLEKTTRKLIPGETLDHSCGLLFLFAGDYIVDITCKVDSGPSVSLKRQRSRPVTTNVSTTDGMPLLNEDYQVSVDGTVTPLKPDEIKEGPERKVLHKPLLNKWERSILIHVEDTLSICG